MYSLITKITIIIIKIFQGTINLTIITIFFTKRLGEGPMVFLS